MQGKSNKILFRHDTFFGVCEAIGQDFGFNPNWLRAVLSISLLLSPVAIFGIYLALGVLVGLSRWMFPAGKAVATTVIAAPSADQALAGANDAAPIAMNRAA